MELYDKITDPMLSVRRITVVANQLQQESIEDTAQSYQQMDLFADTQKMEQEDAALEREKRRQKAVLEIKHKFGKNAILRGMNLEEGATAIQRNSQIGGHKA